MKVMVLGAGAIGSLTSTLLARSEQVDELVVASRRLPPARDLVKKIGRKHVKAKQLDCDRVGDMTKAFKGFDMVVNLVAVAAVFTRCRADTAHDRRERVGIGVTAEGILLHRHAFGRLLDHAHDVEPTADVLAGRPGALAWLF